MLDTLGNADTAKSSISINLLLRAYDGMQVIYGLVLGLIGCFICSLTRIWNNGFKRTTAVLFCGLAIMWLGLKLSYLGASSVGCLSLTVLVSIAWERGFPPRLCKGDHLLHAFPHAETGPFCHHGRQVFRQIVVAQAVQLMPSSISVL